MFGLLRLILRFVWLGLFILGVRRAMELLQGGTDALIQRIEAGEGGEWEWRLERLHAALHRRKSGDAPNSDPFGEM